MPEPSKARKRLYLALSLAVALAAALAWCYDTFVNWNARLFPLAVAASVLAFLALAASAVWPGPAKTGKKLLLILGGLAAFAAAGPGLLFLINNVMYHGIGGARAAMQVSLPLQAVVALLAARLPYWRAHSRKARLMTAASALALFLAASALLAVPFLRDLYLVNYFDRLPVPAQAQDERPAMPSEEVKAARQPTMADYWDGAAYFMNYCSEPGVVPGGTEIVPLNGVWYRFDRYVVPAEGESLGMQVRKSADKGMTWTEPVVVTAPGGGNDWSKSSTDCGAYYDGDRWHMLFQSQALEPGAKWNISYLACDEEDATTGQWYEPPGVVNPVIHNGDIWNQIAVGKNTCTRVSGGQMRIYDEGTPKIVVEDDGTVYVTFHGASDLRGAVLGYRGIASTADFVTYTKAADDCIFSRADAKGWDVRWNKNGSVGGGAAAYLKDGEYWYTLIESPDISLVCVEGQMWPWGLLRSKSLTDTSWENWRGNPIPEFTPVGPSICAWAYAALLRDGGVTYLAVSQLYPEYAYRQYRLAWKE
ncbi:MAG: hypothetical protein LBB75_00050 [Oscillospiraceae bacterium]|jgi:hypothetical protein|nr:hypothetical protein [Oscillospiraceae bacterium]